MPSIHLLYDPRDKITGLPPEVLKEMGLAAIIMRVDDLDHDEVRHYAQQMVAMLMEKINGS